MAASPIYRVLLRRQAQHQRLRWQKSRTPQQRSQSSKAPEPSQPSQPSQPSPARQEDPIPVANTVATLPLWQRLGPLTRAAEAYARAQRKRPLLTQVCSSLVIYFCADISAQRMSGKDYDTHRTGRSLLIGAIASIPSYKWFMFLSTSFNYSSRLLSLATKITVNQLCFTPVFNSYFFGMQALLAGESLEATWDRIRRTVPVSFVNAMKLWPAVTAFSFTFIPMEYRSVFAGVIAVGWQTYLAYLNRKAEVEEAARMGTEGKPAHAEVEAAPASTIASKIPA